MSLAKRIRFLLAVCAALVASSCGGDATGPGSQQHPSLLLVANPSGSPLHAGDSLVVTIDARDSSASGFAALAYTRISITGVINIVDSVPANGASRVRRAIGARLPPTALSRTTLTIAAQVVTKSGEEISSSLPPVTVIDTGAVPKVRGELLTTHAANGAAPGDTVLLTVIASDRDRLAFVGFRFGAPANRADSVQVSTQADTLTTSFVVPESWAGTSTDSVFARDSAGNLTTVAVASLLVSAHTRRPVMSVALPGPIFDAAIDTKWGRVFMSVPSTNQVVVLSLSDMTYGAPYTFGVPTLGLDVTPGGDSLLVALQDTNDIAVMNIPTGATSLMKVTIDSTAGGTFYAAFIRAGANGKALISLGSQGSGFGGRLVDLDLTTGGAVTLIARTLAPNLLGASGNGARVIALDDGACCPEVASIYDAATRSIVAQANTVSRFNYRVSADYEGDLFMIGPFVYDADLRQVGNFASEEELIGPSILSSDGKSVYFPTATGIVQLRLSDGATIDSFTLGEAPTGMWMSRDGLTIFARSDSQRAYVVDVW